MRTNGDQWDITTSVGRTALLVALGRSLESRSESPLIDDPYAMEFIADSKESDLTPEHFDELLAVGAEPAVVRSLDLLQNIMAGRTRRIDTALIDANQQGNTQVVILASGLDARAFRLDWTPDTTVFEVDQPAVLGFKDHTLGRMDARSSATRISVAADLRDDWLGALRAAGLNTDLPTTWVTEGLLPYLLPADQERLLRTIGSVSPTGSVLVLDAAAQPFDPNGLGTDPEVFGIDMGDLLLDNGFFAAQNWLDENGWATSSDSIGALLTSYGRTSEAFSEVSPDGEIFDIVVAHRR